MFKFNSDVHGYETRQSSHFHLPQPNKKLRKSSLCYRGAIIWNSIVSCEISTDVSKGVFAKNLKKLITDDKLPIES